MSDRPAVEVFDGDGPSEVVFVERVTDLLCETRPDLLKRSSREWLENKIGQLIEAIDKNLQFNEQRAAKEAENITEDITTILQGILNGRQEPTPTMKAKSFIQCSNCGGSGQGTDSHTCLYCIGAGKIELKLKPTLMEEIVADNALEDLHRQEAEQFGKSDGG